MKSLVEFINESRVDERMYNDYVLVEPTGPAYDELEEEMVDAMVSNNYGDPNMFILLAKTAKEMAKKYPKHILIYEIPNGEVEQFEEDFENGEIVYDELVQLDPKYLEPIKK